MTLHILDYDLADIFLHHDGFIKKFIFEVTHLLSKYDGESVIREMGTRDPMSYLKSNMCSGPAFCRHANTKRQLM